MSRAPKQIIGLDHADPLAGKRDQFILPRKTIYLDGNSLGVLPATLSQHLSNVVEQQWGEDLIGSWNKHAWIDLPTSVGEKIAPLLGAKAGQVVCCDSISVNLFKLLSAALALRPNRYRVLSQCDNFPTDLYVAEGLADLLGDTRCELITVDESQLLDNLNESIAVLMLTQVNFRSGAMHDIQSITHRAHEVGALVVWDLAHSAGAVELKLDAWNVDFAVGCGYKYLNGGPGAPAFVYVAEEHQADSRQALSGWMGHALPFAFNPQFEPTTGVEKFLSGTPPILSMAALDAALDIFAGVDMHQVRAKSLALSELFIELVEQQPNLHELQLVSPAAAEQRGSQVAFAHPHGYAIAQALIEQGVIVDFRSPDLVRFGFMPLYTRFVDVWRAVQILGEVVESAAFLRPRFQPRARVT